MTKNSLSKFMSEKIIKKSTKIKGKHPPISEFKQNQLKILKIEELYQYQEQNEVYYLFKIKNYDKPPKYRYIIAIKLASMSSDLMVQLGKKFAINNDLKLVQYQVNKKSNRINLLSLKECNQPAEYTTIIQLLKNHNKTFDENIKKLIEFIE